MYKPTDRRRWVTGTACALSLSADALQPGPMHFEPLVRGLAVSFVQRVEPRIKIGAMVHMADVCDLMRDDGAAHVGRGHDQPPAKRNSAMA